MARHLRTKGGVEIRSVFLFPEELDRLDRAAEAAGISRSNWVVQTILAALPPPAPAAEPLRPVQPGSQEFQDLLVQIGALLQKMVASGNKEKA